MTASLIVINICGFLVTLVLLILSVTFREHSALRNFSLAFVSDNVK